MKWYHYLLWVMLIQHLSRSKGVTHWMVTEDGLSIQSVADSPFNMAQPHSLVQFLDQERKLNELSKNRIIINEQEKLIEENEKVDDPDIERRTRASDPDCLNAGAFSSSREAFTVSYSIKDPYEDLEYLISLIADVTVSGKKEVPLCKSDLSFSMYAFEHLEAMQRRKELTIGMEPDLKKSLPSRFRLPDFGHYVALALSKEPTSPPLLNLAALYWRIRGDAPNAVECLRRYLHYSPRDKVVKGIFSLGNVFHLAGYSSDAIILYQLVAMEESTPTVHLALGDAFALTPNRTQAIAEFQLAAMLDPKISNAQLKASALKCDLKLIDVMEKQHKNLLDTIAGRRIFNDKFEVIKSLEESVRKNAADMETRLQQSLFYDYFTYGHNPYYVCRTIKLVGRYTMQCSVSDWRRFRLAIEEKHRKMVASALRHYHVANKTYDWVSEEEELSSPELVALRDELETFRGMNMDEPIFQPKYPRKLEASASKMLENYLSSEWPNKTACEINRWKYVVPSFANLPQLFMNPENKGYSVSDLLTKYLGLAPSQEHPLPWNTPQCGSFVRGEQPTAVTSIFKLPAVLHAESLTPSPKLMEDKLKPVFLHLLDGHSTEADIAQRIKTLIDYGIGPRWLCFNIAALYWRIKGSPNEAITCLRAALYFEPERHADIALTQLASIILRTAKVEHLSDVVAVLSAAMRVNPNEPLTHFLNGLVRLLQGKNSQAVVHFRAALILDPYFQPAVSTLHAVQCAARGKNFIPIQHLRPMCCSSLLTVHCLGKRAEKCFTVHEYGQFEERTCSHQTTNVCRKAAPFALFTFSPSERFFENDGEFEERLDVATDDQVEFMEEIALDYGADESFARLMNFKTKRNISFSQAEVVYGAAKSNIRSAASESESDQWEEDLLIDEIKTPETPLSMSVIRERRQMVDYDVPLPETLPLPLKDQIQKGFSLLPLSKVSHSSFCKNLKMTLAMLHEQTTSTWVSVSAKGVDFEQYLDVDAVVPLNSDFEPKCPELKDPSPLITMDHLPAYHLRNQFIFYKPEKALADAFQSLFSGKERIENVAARLMLAMNAAKTHTGSTVDAAETVHWTLSTASTLYWRVKGDAVNAIRCLRHSLNYAPPNMKDVALVSMANIYHQAGLLHSALIAGGAALQISPRLVAIHFTLANIYASMGDYQHALQFYYSTLSLQSNFEPAKERVRVIFCKTGQFLEASNQRR